MGSRCRHGGRGNRGQRHPPDAERFMAERAGADTIEVDARIRSRSRSLLRSWGASGWPSRRHQPPRARPGSRTARRHARAVAWGTKDVGRWRLRCRPIDEKVAADQRPDPQIEVAMGLLDDVESGGAAPSCAAIRQQQMAPCPRRSHSPRSGRSPCRGEGLFQRAHAFGGLQQLMKPVRPQST